MSNPLSWREITLIVIAAFILFNLLVMLILVPHVVFYNTVYRNPRKKRIRECTNKKDDDQVKMFKEVVLLLFLLYFSFTTLSIDNLNFQGKSEKLSQREEVYV